MVLREHVLLEVSRGSLTLGLRKSPSQSSVLPETPAIFHVRLSALCARCSVAMSSVSLTGETVSEKSGRQPQVVQPEVTELGFEPLSV